MALSIRGELNRGSDTADMPIRILSAKAYGEAVTRGVSVGAGDYVIKTVRPA